MKKHLGLLVVCGGLMMSGGAFAQSHDHGHDHGDSSSQGDHGDRNDQGNRDDHGDHGDRNNSYHSHRAYPSHAYVAPRGRGQFNGMHDRGLHEGWYKRGGRVPANYRGGNYVVTDWRGAHLREPRRGYHWVRSDNGDFLMVAVTTGIIVEILANH